MNHKLTLTIATPLYPPDIGGPATYTKLLEQELPKRDILVRVSSFGESRHLPKGIRHLHYFLRLFKTAKGADVILAQDPVSVGLPALLVARLRRATLIIRMPGDYAWEQSVQRYGINETIDEFQDKSHSGRTAWLQRIQTYVTKKANHIIAPSDYFRRLVIRWGIEEDKVSTIYNGVDFSEQPDFIEKSPRKTMVTAGRLVPWKGVGSLLEVLKQLPDWDLRIIGDGPERNNIETKARELSINDRVHFMGALPHSELLGWCKTADAFVLNTHFESFSFQVVEAMMCGTPVITTDVGSLPELITSGVEGVLLKPDDIDGFVSAIKSVESDRTLWEERTDKAQEKAVSFSIDKTVDKVEKLLKSQKTSKNSQI